MKVPMWFDGKSINEALLCEDFLRTRQINFANGALFTPDGRVTVDLPLRGEIC
ncbi:DNA primase, partial [Faecalibacterium prausnitzii]|nr:DNA primase [Faecalibacterium prausnitzii]